MDTTKYTHIYFILVIMSLKIDFFFNLDIVVYMIAALALSVQRGTVIVDLCNDQFHFIIINSNKPLYQELLGFKWNNYAEIPFSIWIATLMLTLKVLIFWKFTSYYSLKPLWSGMGEECRLVPRRPYIPHPLPLCINCRD